MHCSQTINSFVGDDSESSDSGLDTMSSMSSSTGNSFPSDYMDLDEFLSAAHNQNGQESQAAPKSCENDQHQLATGSRAVVATNSNEAEREVSIELEASLSKTATAVSTVLNSIMLSKVSSNPLNANPKVFQSLQVSAPQPTAATAIIQWCKSVGVTQQEHSEAMGPEPGKTPVRRRRNSKYVYNPMPISKKADRKFVSQGEKDEKYWERRIKNNVAAKRSRDMRRQKEIEISEKQRKLECENTFLKEEIKRLRAKAVMLEQRLSQFQGANM